MFVLSSSVLFHSSKDAGKPQFILYISQNWDVLREFCLTAVDNGETLHTCAPECCGPLTKALLMA